MADVPGVVKFGTVTGFFTKFKHDSADALGVPDEVPLNGTGQLVPSVAQFRLLTTTPKRWVNVDVVPCKVVNGVLLSVDNLPLIVIASVQPAADTSPIQWTFLPQLTDATVQPSNVVFDVPDGGVVDLVAVLPQSPIPGTITVIQHETGSVRTVNGVAPDAEGNVDVSGGSTDLSNYYTKTQSDGRYATPASVTAGDNALDARLDTVEPLVSAHSASITSLSGDVGTLEAEMADALSDIIVLDSRTDALEPAVATLNTNVDNMFGRVNGHDTDIGALQGRATALETRATTAETSATTQDGRLTAIETKNTAQDGRLTALEAATPIAGTAASTAAIPAGAGVGTLWVIA